MGVGDFATHLTIVYLGTGCFHATASITLYIRRDVSLRSGFNCHTAPSLRLLSEEPNGVLLFPSFGGSCSSRHFPWFFWLFPFFPQRCQPLPQLLFKAARPERLPTKVPVTSVASGCSVSEGGRPLHTLQFRIWLNPLDIPTACFTNSSP
jgi:hypothetical protein